MTRHNVRTTAILVCSGVAVAVAAGVGVFLALPYGQELLARDAGCYQLPGASGNALSIRPFDIRWCGARRRLQAGSDELDSETLAYSGAEGSKITCEGEDVSATHRFDQIFGYGYLKNGPCRLDDGVHLECERHQVYPGDTIYGRDRYESTRHRNDFLALCRDASEYVERGQYSCGLQLVGVDISDGDGNDMRVPHDIYMYDALSSFIESGSQRGTLSLTVHNIVNRRGPEGNCSALFVFDVVLPEGASALFEYAETSTEKEQYDDVSTYNLDDHGYVRRPISMNEGGYSFQTDSGWFKWCHPKRAQDAC